MALDVSLDSVVIGRMKTFAQANKLKKMCLMVVGQHLSIDEITGEEGFRSFGGLGGGEAWVQHASPATWGA